MRWSIKQTVHLHKIYVEQYIRNGPDKDVKYERIIQTWC